MLVDDPADAALARGYGMWACEKIEGDVFIGIFELLDFNVAGLPTTWGDPKFKDWVRPPSIGCTTDVVKL
jgi:hypothetical protein